VKYRDSGAVSCRDSGAALSAAFRERREPIHGGSDGDFLSPTVAKCGRQGRTAAPVGRCLAFALTLILSWQTLAGAAASEELHGRVTRVFDGDSFLLRLAGGAIVEVRLAEIDAPERDQPHAEEARSALRGLILDRDLRLRVIDHDRYGRTVARAYLDELDVNADLVGRGHAWVYRRHLRDRSLLDLERAARDAKRGLWALPEAQRTPPWQWRRAHPRSAPRGAQNVDKPVASMTR